MKITLPMLCSITNKAGGKRVKIPYRIFLGEDIIDLLTSNLEEYAKRGYDVSIQRTSGFTNYTFTSDFT